MAQSTSSPTNPTYTVDAPLFPVASAATIYADENVGLNASGYLVPMSDAAAILFMGYALLDGLNAAGGNGAISVPVNLLGAGSDGRLYNFNCTGATQAWVGTIVYFTDDHTVAASSVHSNIAGLVTQFENSTNVVVDVTRRAAT